ncbi:MAG: accessory factor UbiK family protein [Beijerinckiaceae bacterium]|jgi:BMFP domain-containing protein YqiC|nr:accessory factor UbiK family protein [Beijerinckiaceae bacterium]
MTQTRSPIFDDLARLMNDAAGATRGIRREFETIAQTQMERFLSKMDVVTRDEFEAVKEMAALARDENEKLSRRIEELEAKLKG